MLITGIVLAIVGVLATQNISGLNSIRSYWYLFEIGATLCIITSCCCCKNNVQNHETVSSPLVDRKNDDESTPKKAQPKSDTESTSQGNSTDALQKNSNRGKRTANSPKNEEDAIELDTEQGERVFSPLNILAAAAQDKLITYSTNLQSSCPIIIFDNNTTLLSLCRTLQARFHNEHPDHPSLQIEDIQIVMHVIETDPITKLPEYKQYNITKTFREDVKITDILSKPPYNRCDLRSLTGVKVFYRSQKLDPYFTFNNCYFTGKGIYIEKQNENI